MPQAWTLIRTHPDPGSGVGRSTSSRGPPGRETWATRIVAMRLLRKGWCSISDGAARAAGPRPDCIPTVLQTTSPCTGAAEPLLESCRADARVGSVGGEAAG